MVGHANVKSWIMIVGLIGLWACAGGEADPPESSAGFDDEGSAVATLGVDIFQPPAAEAEGFTFKNNAPRCGQPVRDPRRGVLQFRGHKVYSNGLCQGYGISCGTNYSASRRNTLRERHADRWDPCIDSAGSFGAQPDTVASFDPTRGEHLYRWQCTEFVKRVFAAEFGVYGWRGNGGDMMDAGNLPSKTSAIRNGSSNARKPVAGDAIIYKGPQWGHVALVSRVEGNDVFIIGQNEATRERRAQWRNGTLTDPSFPTMPLIGWVHADANTYANNEDERPQSNNNQPDAPENWGTCTANGQPGLCIDAGSCAGQPVSNLCPGPDNVQCCPSPAGNDAPTAECDARRNRSFQCDGERRYRCLDGRWDIERCAHGCDRRLFGEDVCNAPPAGQEDMSQCSDRRNGTWSCDGDRRVRCVGGQWQIEDCPDGCKRRLFGEDRCEEGENGAGVPDVPAGANDLCSDACQYARDGECDDGGAGSAYAVCAFGSDCSDCGARDPADAGNAAEPPPRAIPVEPEGDIPRAVPVQGCEDTCQYAFDGECDDGGPGAHTSACVYGSDCGDCGER